MTPPACPLRSFLAPAFLVLLTGCAQAPVLPAPAAAQPRVELSGGPVRRILVLPGRGALELPIAPDWTVTLEEARPGEDVPPLALRIEPGDGRFLAFVVPEPSNGPADLGRARTLTEEALREAAQGSAEGVLTLRSLEAGGAVRGFWFAATDRELVGRAPSRNEWRGLLRGTALVGDLLVGFDLLDDLPGHHRSTFLELLGSARHLPPEGAEPALPASGGSPVSELSVAWPGQAWAVAVGVPGFLALAPAEGAPDASVTALAWEPASGLRAAVTLREADGAGSAVACRERDWARVLGATEGVREGRVAARGDSAFASYLAPGVDGRQPARRHARAWLWRDGLCVDVHLSGPGASAEGSFEPILASLRFVGVR